MRVSIEGNIGSGKSEALAFLAKALPTVPVFPEPVESWGCLTDKFYQNPQEWAFAFSVAVLLGFRAPLKHSTCIVERSPLACREVFGQMLYNDGTLNCQEWALFKAYHDELGWEPDVIFFVDTPVETCMDRIRQRGRSCEARITEEYLRRIEFLYTTNMLRFAEKKIRVIRLDGSPPPDDLHARLLDALGELGPAFASSSPS